MAGRNIRTARVSRNMMKKGWSRRLENTKRRKRRTKLDIVKQSREREPMPRPTVFRNRKKYDRNLLKDMERKGHSDT